MKSLNYIILLLLCILCSSFCTPSKCGLLHTGTFSITYKAKREREEIIIDQDTYELRRADGKKYKGKIEWVDECTFILMSNEVQPVDTAVAKALLSLGPLSYHITQVKNTTFYFETKHTGALLVTVSTGKIRKISE